MFKQRLFTLSGFTNPERDNLKKMGVELGLIFADDITDGMLVVSAFQKSKKMEEIKKFKSCVAVNREYLLDCKKYKAEMLTGDYPVK